MLNWLLRYKPAMELVDEAGSGLVLDVGSGRHGLSWFADREVVQTDLEFPAWEPDDSRVGTAHFVAARAERLPFADGAFESVIALDLLEHMPASLREEAVREMCRVATTSVVIGYPDGRDAARLDRFLGRVLRLLRRPLPIWLDEHLDQSEYPDGRLLDRAVAAPWSVAAERRSGNVYLQGLLVLAEWVPGLNRVLAALEPRLRRRRVPWWYDRGRTYRGIWVLRRDAA